MDFRDNPNDKSVGGSGLPHHQRPAAFSAIDVALNAWVYLDAAVPTWVRIGACALCVLKFVQVHRTPGKAGNKGSTDFDNSPR